MRLKPYPEYKNSGVAWIGEVPYEWSLRRVGDIAEVINGFPFDSKLFGPTGFHLIRIRDINSSDTELKYSGDVVTRALVTRDDVLVGMDGDFNVGRWASDEPALLNQRVLALRGQPDVITILGYALSEPLKLINDVTYATTVKHLSSFQVKQIRIALPESDQELRALADYLDRETAEIDAFIADQEELIALLKERRTATITRAVAKGLDPDAPMKASGVEWLGAIPSHWTAGNIRRFAFMRTGHTPSRSNAEYWIDCEIPWFTLADVWQLRKGARYLGETRQQISQLGLDNSSAELLPAGTVVLSRTASVGFVGIMPIPMATSQDYWNWVCGPKLHPEYLWYQLTAMRPFFGTLIQGSTHKTIYKADAASLKIGLPPIVEQREIVDYLDRETSDMDAAIVDANQAISLSRERRAALISAAVTGKIDVRDTMTERVVIQGEPVGVA